MHNNFKADTDNKLYKWEEKMIKTEKIYKCTYFYDKEGSEEKRELAKNETHCNKFVYDGKTVKCYIDVLKEYYNLVSVNDGTGWKHPVKFIENVLKEE